MNRQSLLLLKRNGTRLKHKLSSITIHRRKKNCVAPLKVVDKAKVHSVAGSHFMAAVLKQIYLDDVSGFEPAFPFWWHSPLASVGPAQTAELQCIL